MIIFCEYFKIISDIKQKCVGSTLMKKYVYAIDLHEESIEDYKEYHRSCWEEVEGALKKAGVLSMETYLIQNRLVTIITGDDNFDCYTSLKTYADCERVCQWDDIMRKFQKPLDEAKEAKWLLMEKVYDSEWHGRWKEK